MPPSRLARFARFCRPLMVAAIVFGLAGAPARAVDPPYQAELERLANIMGSLYFLYPVCGHSGIDWRLEAARLIDDEQPDDERRARLEGAFNDGYESFARLYNRCTESARTALERFLDEGERIARDIRSRYAE